MLLEGVEQTGGSACPRLAPGRSWTSASVRRVNIPSLSCGARQAVATPLAWPGAAVRRRRSRRQEWGRCARPRRRRRRSARLRSMPITGVMPLPAVRNRISRERDREREFPCGGASWTMVSTDACSYEVVGDLAAGDRLDRDCDAPVPPFRQRGQGIGAPLAHAVDVDTDADVLPGRMRRPPRGRSQPDGRGVSGFRQDASTTPRGSRRAHSGFRYPR